jgi:hypothetical protein
MTASQMLMASHWGRHLKGDPTAWLLEEESPSVRYFALRDLLHRPPDDQELVLARAAIMDSRPVREILAAQYPEGYWYKPGRGYSPKYRATVWQVMFLADLGAAPDAAVRRGCEVVLEHSYFREKGLFSAAKSGTETVACLNGNLLAALRRLGYGDHPTVQTVYHALADRIVTEGFACRFNATDRSRRETWLPCAWGAIKALRAFALLPGEDRPSVVAQAAARGVEFLLSRDPAVADYPSARGQTSRLWFRFGFPLGYHSDVLEAVDLLAQLGYGADRRLAGAIEFILGKQDSLGRWPLEHVLDKTWTSFGEKGKPSKWVTLRALTMLSSLPVV